MEKAIQLFSDEYLEYCKKLTPDQIVEFLEQFRKIAYAGLNQSTTIEIKNNLFYALSTRATHEGKTCNELLEELISAYLRDKQ